MQTCIYLREWCEQQHFGNPKSQNHSLKNPNHSRKYTRAALPDHFRYGILRPAFPWLPVLHPSCRKALTLDVSRVAVSALPSMCGIPEKARTIHSPRVWGRPRRSAQPGWGAGGSSRHVRPFIDHRVSSGAEQALLVSGKGDADYTLESILPTGR